MSSIQSISLLPPQFPSIHACTRIHCVPAGKRPSSSFSASILSSDSREIVRFLIRTIHEKEPLARTLSKYVKVIRTEHCFYLFEELGKTEKWLQCLEVFRWMQKQRWYVADNGVYSKLISVMGKKGQIRMAMWLFSEMRSSGCRPDTSVYNSLISAHLHSKDTSKALLKSMVFFEKMKEIPRCSPNLVTYNILLRAFAQARDTTQVNALFLDLSSRSIKPDITTFNSVMDAYGKNGMIKEMEATLALMKTHDCKPDTITFNSLIDSYGKKQEFAKMELVFKSLMKSKEKATLPTFNSMIVNYGKARQKESAERVLKKMVDMGYSPNLITYESAIMMYGFCGCPFDAREVFDGMIASRVEVKVSTLNILLDAFCRNDLHAQAYLLLGDLKENGVLPNTATYKALYKAFYKARRDDLLQKLDKQMERDAVVFDKRNISVHSRDKKYGGRSFEV